MTSKKAVSNKTYLFILLVLSGLAVWTFSTNVNSEKTQEKAPIVDTKVTQELSGKTESSFSLNEASVEKRSPDAIDPDQQKKLEIVEEILASKNDNDPRIDSDLKNLSSEIKTRLKEKYRNLKMEDRNGRGFIAFLIARDLQSVEDASFLKEIYLESPCLSLSNCSSHQEEDPHLDGINNTSLNYPQMVTLYQLERKLEGNSGLLSQPEFRREIESLLREAKNFPAPGMQSRAEALSQKIGL